MCVRVCVCMQFSFFFLCYCINIFLFLLRIFIQKEKFKNISTQYKHLYTHNKITHTFVRAHIHTSTNVRL